MKRLTILHTIITIVTGLVLCTDYNASAQCTARSIIKNCQSNFKNPYQYSACWMSEFTLEKKETRIEGHFVAFEGEKYQIMFCSSGSAKEVIINIYDKSIRARKGRKLYDSSENMNSRLWLFEPPKSGDYFVEYIIPSNNTEKIKTGCIMLLIGTITGKYSAG